MKRPSKSVTLPPVIRREVARLPDAARDVVAQQLRSPPSPPIIYEDAIRQLASIRDIDTTKRVLLAAEGLALWGKMHEDNRAIIEAQKLKAHALRQMFICAKALGEPYEILAEKRVWNSKARRGEELASYDDKEDIDRAADAFSTNVRPEYLVGKIADRSPLGQTRYIQRAITQEELEAEESERRRRSAEDRQKQAEKDEQERKRAATPRAQFMKNVFEPLASVHYNLEKVLMFDLASCSPANNKAVKKLTTGILELLDKIDEACK